jgi:maleate isomerase
MNNELRRFGVLAPPGNIAMERELPPLLPPHVVMNHNRLSRPGSSISAESLRAMAESVDRAAHDLAQAHPEVILYGCTSGSFLAGIGRESEIAQRIADITGIAAVTTSTAVVAALRAVGARTLFMLTPYPDDINDHEVRFLAHYDFKVHGWDAFRCATSEKIRAVSSEEVAALALGNAAAIAECDALFISCTNLLTIDQIAGLEDKLRKPVVTSNQASLWAVLRHMDVDTRDLRAGQLFSRPGEIGVSTAASAKHSKQLLPQT